jgi:hypothetical protein
LNALTAVGSPKADIGTHCPISRCWNSSMSVSPYILAGIAAEAGDGPVINGGSLTASR